ncbi:MAG TPA: patatin-like phospholipase family protein [Puia sp.]|nr:patatin-like phospholipase family protein [Puia sp.]
MPQKTKELKTADFINDRRVIDCMTQLKTHFKEGTNPFVVSDVLDGEGRQYVNLVQKGGGVLGIALVGYTWVLEAMNIRFIRLAGTSAGAINTALMTVIGKKEDAKSEKVLDSICKLEFIRLVDGHPVARRLISSFIKDPDFTGKIRRWILGILIGLVLLLTGDIAFLGLQKVFSWAPFATKLCFTLTGVSILILCILLSYMTDLLGKLKNAGFGINPGDYLYDWIKEQLAANGVNTVTQLNAKAGADIAGLHLRIDNPEKLNGLKGDVTFIASELVTENKIQFPGMCKLFRKEADIDTLQPAGFVRASMSIPIFFESYFISNIPCQDPEIIQAWKELNEDNPPSTTRFVDGGILSNFPINLFYNPNVIVPRLPSFGIDLDDSKPDDSANDPEKWSPAGYFGRMFNTIRNYYDKDFLIKNKILEKGIGTIPLADFNWLNFFLTDQNKIDMFVRGAEAATKFLIGFKWEDYKEDRSVMRKELIQIQTPNAQKQNIQMPNAQTPASAPSGVFSKP